MAYQGVSSRSEPVYAGSESCKECHPREYELWRTSPHATNIRAAHGELAGAMWAVGRTNIIQYLKPMPNGTLQTMRWAWDLRKGEWFDAPAENVRPWVDGDKPLDWRHPAWNFTLACERCHVAPAGNISNAISCEGCHGPLSKHVKAPHLHKPARLGAESCRRCHSKTYADGRIALLEDVDFTADGRDLGENYTWGTWLMRRSKGLNCLTCHTSSGRMKTTPANACLQCHGDIDLASHSRHVQKPGLRTPDCASCHMPKTSFGRIFRSDHSFRPPDPQMAVLYDGKSACAACHDRSESENAKIVESWHPQSRLREEIRKNAEIVHRARKGDEAALAEPPANRFIKLWNQ